jgi:DNA modification methylase
MAHKVIKSAKRTQKGSIATIGDLTPDPRNARKHTPRNVSSIVDALHKVGAARSIVIDERGVILAGNATVEAAGEAGIEKVQVVDADGETLIAVRRRGLSAKQKAELAILDNRAAELAEWNVPELKSLVQEFDISLPDIAFDDKEFAALGQGEQPEVAEDEVPTDAPKRCNAGDLWVLGEHRLLCGDSTKAEDVGRVLGGRVPFIMVTDPPYGVEYDSDWRLEAGVNKPWQKLANGKVENDDRTDWSESYKLFPGHVAYVWHAGRFAADLVLNLRASGFEIRTQLIWRKPSLVMGRGHYHWQHEPCWYAVRANGSAKWCGDRTQSTIWDIANMHATQGEVDDGKTNHSTQKPVECMARPIRNHGNKDDDVYDPFLGSGTTIIAAEQLGRRCFGLEISPKYCDIILQRWENLTGNKARREGDF